MEVLAIPELEKLLLKKTKAFSVACQAFLKQLLKHLFLKHFVKRFSSLSLSLCLSLVSA